MAPFSPETAAIRARKMMLSEIQSFAKKRVRQARQRRSLSPFLESYFQVNKEERSMSETSTLIGYGGRTIGREELALVPTPPATETHRPVPHHEIVQALVETLGL